jgi:chemotaxis protein MotB
MTGLRRAFLPLLTAFALLISGCGHTDEEMAEKQRAIDKLQADLKAAQQLHSEEQRKHADAQNQIEALRGQLEQAGVSGQRSREELERLQKAIAEYKQRADQLAVIEQRFRDLRTRLEKLTSVGVKFVVRENRMVIQLPGDILFDSGRDELKRQGKDVLLQVAEVIRNDKDLNARHFQVAGHTDNAKYPPGGPFRDNWGLSLARARQVLLFLITPTDARRDPGGGLSPDKWAASGYGETDPVAGTVEAQTPEQQQRNRRVELVLQPNVDEMLNLSNIK